MRRGRRLGMALLLVGLAGCARTPDQKVAESCARVADRDPAVQDAEMRILGASMAQAQFQPALVAARQRAELACLRARGEAPPGGVQGVPRAVGRF